MSGALKLGIAVTLAVAAVGLLFVAAAGARERGRISYCRNNLRKLGEMAFLKLGSEEGSPATGRKFWQEVRVENFTTVKAGKETWVIRFGGLNPFGCPVRGVQPIDLSELSEAELERHMSNPGTIDFRGPNLAPGLHSVRMARPLGADLPGNHPNGGGHVLLVDLSVREVREAVSFKEFRDAAGADAELAD
jgi:hypothetical protein